MLKLEGLLGLGQHVQAPRAHLAVGRYRDEVVRVLRADDARAVDGVCVRAGGERRALHRRPLVVPVIPEHDLAGVCAAQDQVRVEPGGEGEAHLIKSKSKTWNLDFYFFSRHYCITI